MLATVLFADITGSTERAAALGDNAWRELLEAFYAKAREVLQHYRGREVNTSGDGLLAAFDGPARAIRCAGAIRDTVRSLGLEVRCGLHTGECELVGNDLAGIAVHIGARVASLAAPGEVLVSQTVRDEITAATLPSYATIGLNLGTFGWETNFPRTRGINHIVQVVRRPADQMPFVSEAIGPDDKGGVRLMPIDQWLAAFNSCISGGNAWAVDPFAMANRRRN